MTPLLVDSSAWIQLFSRHPDSALLKKVSLAREEKTLATCGMVQLEVVRGARDQKEYRELVEEFGAMLWLTVEEQHWDLATTMGFELGKKGFHPPATDLLIAAVAIQYHCRLLQKDKHYTQIARYFPLSLT